jgi:hypothetical protein
MKGLREMNSEEKIVVLHKIYQIKITLKNIKPPVWRRLQVPSDFGLEKLHTVIQIAMGWSNSHLHQFTAGDTYYGEPDPDYDDDVMKSENGVTISQLVSGEGARFNYEYDFGDSWKHEILVEKILPMEKGTRYPVCIKGKRACPPEDVGGVWGYADFLETITDPKDPEYEDTLEWAGGDFDPETFDIEEVNKRLNDLG